MNSWFVRAASATGALLALSSLLSGCATSRPTPIGAVLPMEAGKFQSTVKSEDQAQALKTFDHDASLTCTKGAQPTTPWGAKPAPGKYVLLSQSVKSKDGKDIKSENKALDAGIAVGLRYMGLESKDSVEVTSMFRCE